MEKEKVNFLLKSGASLVKTRPIFSPDSKYLFVCSGSIIKVYSVQSGECVHELKGHTDYVTCLAIHPKNKLQLLSCSLDQKIIVWDYTDGIFLRDIHLKSGIHGIYTVERWNKVYALQQDNADKQVSHLSTVSLSKQSEDNRHIVRGQCSNDIRKTAVCSKGTYIATVQGTKLIWKFLNTGKIFKLKVDGKSQFTCVVSHPTQDRITTGCSDGKIYTWYERNGEVVNSLLHWHSLPVKDLCYTVEGSYLLSGGHECVLVKWHPESGYKDYLPRLGAPLSHIVCSRDNLFYAVCQDDNVVQLITSNLVIQNVYQGLTRCYIQSKVTEQFPAGMNYDPKSKALVLNGKPGHVQFYSVHEDKQLFNLDIVCQNFISSESVDKPLAVTDVVRMAFNSTGSWLATVEYWNDGVMTPEMRLKFWYFKEEKQSFVLNTSVETPHDGKVNTLMFRPMHEQSSPGMQHLAVTSSNDEKFKVWTLVDDTDIYRTNNKWMCEAVGFYRNLPAGQADFSDDGSLLAVGFGPNVTLWNPENNLLKRTLSNALSQDPIKHVKFGQFECSHYLVSTTETVLTVWNLITCTVVWSTDVNTVCLTKDPCTDYIAAFTQSKELIVFRPSSPCPVFAANSVSTTSVLSATFVPHCKKSCYEKTTLSWQNKSELYFINKDQELLCVSLEKDSKSVRKEKDAVTLKQNLPQSALSLLVGRHSNTKNQPDTQNRIDLLPNEKFTREMLSSAAHVQPSVTSLCRPFIQSLLISAQSGSGVKTDDSDDDDDDVGVDVADEKFDTQTMSQDSGLEIDMETDEVKTPQEKVSDIQLQSIVSSDLSWYKVS